MKFSKKTAKKNGSFNSWAKYIFPTLGLLLLWNQFFYTDKSVSFLDYEGFSISGITSFLFAILLIIAGLYFFRGGTFDSMFKWKGKKKIVLILIIVFVGFEIIISPRLKSGAENYKYYLPLNRIQTSEIIGTTTKHTSIWINDYGPDHREDMKRHRPSVALHGGLKEYPNIYFDYPSELVLKTEVENIRNKNPERMAEQQSERYQRTNKEFPNYVKYTRLPEGTKVKLKIRSTDFNKINALNDSKSKVSFYELIVGKELLVRKFGIQ